MSDKEKRSSHDAFVRWQQVSREQLGNTVNLVLTLTTAAIAFVADLAIKKDLAPTPTRRCEIMGALGLAPVLGILVNVTRLLDFRWTTRAARVGDLKEEYVTKCLSEFPQFPKWLKQLKNWRIQLRLWWIWRGSANHCAETKKSVARVLAGNTEMATDDFRTIRRACHDIADWFGEWTWRLLPCQLVAFAFGVFFLILALPSTNVQPPNPHGEVGRFVETDAGSFILMDTKTGQWCLGVNKKSPNSDLDLCRDLR